MPTGLLPLVEGFKFIAVGRPCSSSSREVFQRAASSAAAMFF